MKTAKKGLSLIEVLIAIFIVVAAVGALATLYPGIFRGINLDAQTLKAWEVCKRGIETVKNTSFSALYNQRYSPGNPPQPLPFSTGDTSITGFYYIDRMYDKNDTLLVKVPPLMKIAVSSHW